MLSIPPQISGPDARVWRRLVGAAQTIGGRLEDWRATRRLLGADEAMFKDIGVSRGNVDWAVRHGRNERMPTATGGPGKCASGSEATGCR